MRNFFLKGLAALTMGFAITSCMQEFSLEEQELQASLDNAQQTLGFYIPDNQDWVMTTTATATFTIKGLSDDATVYVFSNNPYADGYGSVLASGQTTGTTTTLSGFRIPAYVKALYVGVKESNGNVIYKYVDVEDGNINADYDFSTPIRARTRSVVPEIDDPFPAYTTEQVNAMYKTSIPSSAKTWDEMIEASRRADWGGDIDYNNLNNFPEIKLLTGTYGIHLTSNSRDIYISGEVTLNVDDTNSMNQARIYLLPNSTLNFNMSNYINDLEIYVASNATLNYSYSMLYKQTGGGIIFNRGTLNLPEDFQANQNSIIYNEGTVNGTNITSAPGDGRPSFFYNYGTLDLSGNFQLNSCANFFNEGTVTVGGLSECTQGNSDIWWINKGHYTTRRFKIQAWNGTYYNYCQLIVTEDAHLHDGQFNLMQNGYIEAASADCNNLQVNMGGNTGFNIKGNSYWGAQGDNTYQGFYATGSNNYVRLGGTTTVAEHKYSLQTTGNITIAFNNLVDLGANNSGVWPTVQLNEGKTEVDFSALNPTYSKTDCGATWSGDSPVVTPVVENQTWTYAFEDNKTRCDFDMNDVVIQVKESEADPNILIVRLVAAGCQYDNYVWLGDNLIEWPNGTEVHEAFGADHGVMVNTGRGVDRDPVITTIAKPIGFVDLQNAAFKIRPYKINSERTEANAVSDYITIANETTKGEDGKIAKAPLGIAIPAEWKWPSERTIVTIAYPTPNDNSHSGFATYGSEEDPVVRVGLTDWYKYPVEEYVYSK